MLRIKVMRAMGLDVGAKTIGLALSDPTRTVATAMGVVSRRGQVDDAAAVIARIRSDEVDCVVVGMPLELDGRVGRRAKTVGRFVEQLRASLVEAGLDVSVRLWDERFSTLGAERTLLEADLSREKRKAKIDAMAAQFILRGWLDSQRTAEAR